MAMRSWVLKSWPEVVWQPPASSSLWPLFHHMGTEVRIELDELGRTIGETVWAAQLDDGSLLGAAWEWVEAVHGVPALRDPNGFISNLRLVDDDGAVEPRSNCSMVLKCGWYQKRPASGSVKS